MHSTVLQNYEQVVCIPQKHTFKGTSWCDLYAVLFSNQNQTLGDRRPQDCIYSMLCMQSHCRHMMLTEGQELIIAKPYSKSLCLIELSSKWCGRVATILHFFFCLHFFHLLFLSNSSIPCMKEFSWFLPWADSVSPKNTGTINQLYLKQHCMSGWMGD